MSAPDDGPVVTYYGSRARIRDLFVRCLGVIYAAAFVSLLAQVTLLIGEHGLLPAGYSDTTLRAGAVVGTLLSVGLAANVAPRYCLAALGLLYWWFVSIGRDFFFFQWDNLLLESAFFALFVTPGGLRPRDPPSPNPVAVFLMQWLVFRLHVESGAAKLLVGDPTWRDLTAMVSYYETAPLPAWPGWWVHQLPVWAHQLCGLYTYVVELALPFCLWGPRFLRMPAFVGMIAMQVSIVLTANYGIFNYLSAALCLWMLDDAHLGRFGRATTPPEPPRRATTIVLAAVAAVLVPISVVPFLPFVEVPRAVARAAAPVGRALNTTRAINAYHLFASMTLVRRDIVIEGSDDGTTWKPYELRYKPGDPNHAPPFVAPHQPRVDFQLWFLLLGGRRTAPYFDTLLRRLREEPATVAPLFARDPFPTDPPRHLRVAVYRYQFTDVATRRATGAWWRRELLGYLPGAG